jgi:hypothetical protein
VFTKDPQREFKEKFLKAAAPNVEKVHIIIIIIIFFYTLF